MLCLKRYSFKFTNLFEKVPRACRNGELVFAIEAKQNVKLGTGGSTLTDMIFNSGAAIRHHITVFRKCNGIFSVTALLRMFFGTLARVSSLQFCLSLY